MTDAVVIQTTAGSPEEAERIAEGLLADRLCACVQIAQIRSRYVWKGAVQREDEQLLLIKTRAEFFEAVRSRIRELHSYETPEVIAVPLAAADPDYLAWLEATTQS
jgi:periplasmic divalent cation tolerance protein